MAAFIAKLREKGVSTLNADPKTVPSKNFRTLHESEQADMVICKTLDQLKSLRSSGRTLGYFKKVLSNADVDEIERASHAGAAFVIVDASDWR